VCVGGLLQTDPQERAKTTTASSDCRPRPTVPDPVVPCAHTKYVAAKQYAADQHDDGQIQTDTYQRKLADKEAAASAATSSSTDLRACRGVCAVVAADLFVINRPHTQEVGDAAAPPSLPDRSLEPSSYLEVTFFTRGSISEKLRPRHIMVPALSNRPRLGLFSWVSSLKRKNCPIGGTLYHGKEVKKKESLRHGGGRSMGRFHSPVIHFFSNSYPGSRFFCIVQSHVTR